MSGCRCFLPVFVALLAIPALAAAQSSANIETRTTGAIREDLMRSFQLESKRGTSIFYTQAYKVKGRRVEFHGSIFGVIDGVEPDGCELRIKSEIVDLYSGNIGNNLAGRTQSKYISSVDFKLSAQLAADLQVVPARPVRQLAVGSNAMCAGARQCTMTWIKAKTERNSIHLTEFTDDVADYDGEVKDFDGSVNQFWLPVSSNDAGIELIEKMRAYAQVCSK